jgi:GntR family transcriptional repressor for pyruvate dehydrogenase complex
MARAKPDQQESHRTMQVVNHVRAMIENGTLKPGDKIPPERDLARTLLISRASLRTGIGYLAALGVMKIRHGVGTFVADGPPDFGQTGLAALAAERSRDEHQAALAEEVAEMFASVDNPTEYLIHDVAFHRIIAQASGNPILAAIMETIVSSMYDSRRKTVERSIDLRESAGMHREIYRAIRTRKPAEARRLMEQHLRMAQAAQGLERPVGKRSVTSEEKAGAAQESQSAL